MNWNVVNDSIIILLSSTMSIMMVGWSFLLICRRDDIFDVFFLLVVKLDLLFYMALSVFWIKWIISRSSPYKRMITELPDFQHIEIFSGSQKITKSGGIFYELIKCLIVVWGIGALMYLIIFIYEEILKKRALLRDAQSCDSEERKEQLKQLKNEMKIRRDIGLYETTRVQGPALIGILFPKIIIPTEGILKREYEFLLKHELFHYKNKDIFFKMLVCIL